MSYRPVSGPENFLCPQQTNNYDCGIYCILFGQRILQKVQTINISGQNHLLLDFFRNSLSDAVSDIEPNEAALLRKYYRNQIVELSGLSNS